ncbi:MAG: hypothetical protein AB1714_03925 [Acidobacteriota bacterium]
MRLAIGGTMATFHGRFARQSFADDRVVMAMRRLLSKSGIDPEKTPPASETLAQRILDGEEFPRRSEPDDLAGLLMLKTLVPWSVTASSRVRQPLRFRLGRAGETLRSGEDVRPVLGWPVLEDAEQIVASPLMESHLEHAGEADEILLACYQPAEMADVVAAKVHLARFVVMTWAFRFLEEKTVVAGR